MPSCHHRPNGTSHSCGSTPNASCLLAAFPRYPIKSGGPPLTIPESCVALSESGVQTDSSAVSLVGLLITPSTWPYSRSLLVVDGPHWSTSLGPETAQNTPGRPTDGPEILEISGYPVGSAWDHADAPFGLTVISLPWLGSSRKSGTNLIAFCARRDPKLTGHGGGQSLGAVGRSIADSVLIERHPVDDSRSAESDLENRGHVLAID